MSRTQVSSGLALALLLAFIGAQAVHWLLTPQSHPGASDLRRWAVVAQAAIGLIGAVWVWRRSRGAHAVQPANAGDDPAP